MFIVELCLLNIPWLVKLDKLDCTNYLVVDSRE